jgi:3'-phosphoadenosine 5'-phosphosulfate sulfotransferase (PAPS reductase)/FAD synthetase
MKIKIIVQFSGGKDSLASLLWTLNESGYKKENIEAVFCDTGWEHEQTYQHINEVCAALSVPLVVVRSKKYKDFVDMAVRKKRFPSAKARFCTEHLKTIPMIDYILDHCDHHVIIIQGIRADESTNRSLMSKQCTYFRYYYEPYGYDKKGRPKYHTYRKKDVMAFRSKHLDDVIRPVFDWTGQQVIDYILQNGLKPNPLYYQGASRVGCYPCIMCRHHEIKSMATFNPSYIERLREAEETVGRTFFPPDYIPKRYCSLTDPATGTKIPSVDDVVRYIKDKNATGTLFDERESDDGRCMSFYGICE